jgi:hypothetical protein
MANFRYSHLYTTKTGSEAITAAESALKQAEIGLAIAKDEEKILFKNERGEVISISSDAQTETKIEELENALNNEVSRATSAETAEATAREAADTELLNAISGEVQNRIADVDAEETRAKAAEEVLSEEIDTLDDKIDQEITDRKAEAVADVKYDESEKTIDFYNKNEVKIASIDATEFIKDGMIDSVTLETTGGTTYLVIVWNTASGKEETRIDIGDIFDADNYYTKAEIDTIVSGITGDIEEELDEIEGALNNEIARATSAETGLVAAIEAEATARGNADVKRVTVDENAGITLTLGDGSTIVATEAEEITLSAGEF